MANQTERLHYFDMLKGIAIFMVVMGHVITFCVREIDSTPLFKFIGEIHMPLFFFISGWFGYRTINVTNLKSIVVSRFKQLIVPMVAVSALWIYYFPHSGLESPLDSSFPGLWNNLWKNGYWFTLVLFEIIIFQLALNRVFKRFEKFYARVATALCVWIMLYFINKGIGETASNLLSFGLVSAFWPAYISGFIAAGYSNTFARLLKSNLFITACFVIAAPMLYILCWYWEFPFISDEVRLYVVGGLFHIPLAIIAIAAVKPWAEQAYSATATVATRTIADIWALLGRKSLAIYLMHYFFLFNLSVLRQTLLDVKLGFVPIFILAAGLSTVIIAVVLMFERIISTSPLLAWLLSGTPMKKTNKIKAQAS